MKTKSNICVTLIDPWTFEQFHYDSILSKETLIGFYSTRFLSFDVLIYIDNNLAHIRNHVSI